MNEFQELIERLQWVADLDDIDHDICDIAKEAIEAIDDLQNTIELSRLGF